MARRATSGDTRPGYTECPYSTIPARVDVAGVRFVGAGDAVGICGGGIQRRLIRGKRVGYSSATLVWSIG